jgi:hypothetical protein
MPKFYKKVTDSIVNFQINNNVDVVERKIYSKGEDKKLIKSISKTYNKNKIASLYIVDYKYYPNSEQYKSVKEYMSNYDKDFEIAKQKE